MKGKWHILVLSLRCREENTVLNAIRGWGKKGWSLLSFAAAAGVLGLLICSGITGCKPLGLGYVGTDTCLKCHNGQIAEDKQSFLTSPHAAATSCEGCHGPGYFHVRNGGRYGLFANNRVNTRQVCDACHHAEVADYLKSAHAEEADKDGDEEDVSCASCHDPHTNAVTSRPFTDNQLCLQCHVYESDFTSEAIIQEHTFHAYDPAGTGASRCVACHMVPKQRANQSEGVFDHSMRPVPPIASNESGITSAPPNSCSGVMGCHDGTVSTAPVFSVDDPQMNVTLQGIYDTRYGS